MLDANVIVSGFPSERGAPAELIERWLSQEFRVIISEHILDGVRRAWANPWYRERFAEHEALRALDLLHTRASIVEPAPGIRGVATDLEDDRVLATAVAGNAD